MRRAGLLLCALLFAGCPATASAITISSPAGGETFPSRPHFGVLSYSVPLSGTGPKGHRLRVSTRCAIGECWDEVEVDGKQRWRTWLDVVAADVSEPPTIRVTDLTNPEATQRRVWVRVRPPAATSVEPSPPLLGVIGDSLGAGTEVALPAEAAEWSVTTLARGGRRLASGMRLFESTPLPVGRPFVAVFSLFTNDDPRAVAALEAAVRRSVERVGPGGCAVWATIARPPVKGVSYARANGLLRRLAADPAFGGRLQVAEWAKAYRAHKSWRHKDRVHATHEGYAGRARLLAEAARRCPQVTPR